MPLSPVFCLAKWKKGNKGKKERVWKYKLSKSCDQSQNVTVLAIIERLKFKNISCRPTMVANNTFQCSMALRLRNPFRRQCLYFNLNCYCVNVNMCVGFSDYYFVLLTIEFSLKNLLKTFLFCNPNENGPSFMFLLSVNL